MKVICISENFFSSIFKRKPTLHPKFGDVLTVTGYHPYDSDFYKILEYPTNGLSNNRSYWRCENFIPLSDIDEKELIKERELVNA